MAILEYGTLYLPDVNEKPVRRQRRKNGTFDKGNVPANKGKKWEEYYSPQSIENMKKGWANLDKYRHIRKKNAGRQEKAVIAIFPDGSWKMFTSISVANKWFGVTQGYIQRCCAYNKARHVDGRNGKVNTDHMHKGVRFYYESDNIWLEKIKK